ncbi:exonuclease [Mycobacterium phage Cookies]|nr:exonuclease [Mycobacterium phage Pat3]QAY06594.1 exonuclease [Mycobacterium phage Cookies]
MTDYTVKRNYKGQVLVAAPDAPPVTGEWVVSKDGKDYFRTEKGRSDVEPYSRTSKAGEHLKGSGEALSNFAASMAALGVVMNGSVHSELATLINEYDGDPYYKGDDGGWKSGKKRLLEQVDIARKVAGASSASAKGTEFHKLAEIVNKGKTPTVVREELKPRLAEYQRRVSKVKFLRQEILIVNDLIKRAGSIDYLMELPAGLRTPDGVTHDEPIICAGDLKTGKWDRDYPAGVYAQLFGYAGGFRYNQETNERLPLHPNFNDRWAVLVHYPLVVPGSTVEFYWLDMEVGREAALLNKRLDDMIKYFQSTKGKPIHFELESA